MNLNESFEALKNMAMDAAQAAARATKSAVVITRSNINILTEQEKQRKAYLELGKLYYRDFITGEEPDDAEYLPICERITEAAKNIEALKNGIDDLKSDPAPVETEPEEETQQGEASPEEAKTVEETLNKLSEELDNLQKELKNLDDAGTQVEEAVFEVVDEEEKKTEPKTEE